MHICYQGIQGLLSKLPAVATIPFNVVTLIEVFSVDGKADWLTLGHWHAVQISHVVVYLSGGTRFHLTSWQHKSQLLVRSCWDYRSLPNMLILILLNWLHKTINLVQRIQYGKQLDISVDFTILSLTFYRGHYHVCTRKWLPLKTAYNFGIKLILRYNQIFKLPDIKFELSWFNSLYMIE